MMLFDKNVLSKLNNERQNDFFNIHVLLQLLQHITRPLGYLPDYNKVCSKYYLNLIHARITEAKQNKNCQRMHFFLHVLQQLAFCFCYVQSAVSIQQIDKALLFMAIDKRLDSTDEERCAEKSLLEMILAKPRQTLLLLARHCSSLSVVNMQVPLQEQIALCRDRVMQELTVSQAKPAAIIEVNRIFDKTNEDLKACSLHFSKEQCHITIGLYLLNNERYPLAADWIKDSSLLIKAVRLALQEQDKQQVAAYIKKKQEENKLYSLFKAYSKEVKLNAAKKFLQYLTGERHVFFSSIESSALETDKNSQLTKIFLHHQKWKKALNKGHILSAESAMAP